MTETMKCQKCGAEVPRTGTHQKYCKQCAQIVIRERWQEASKRKQERRSAIKKAGLKGSDTPEMIQKCLNCELPRCVNCLYHGKMAGE